MRGMLRQESGHRQALPWAGTGLGARAAWHEQWKYPPSFSHLVGETLSTWPSLPSKKKIRACLSSAGILHGTLGDLGEASKDILASTLLHVTWKPWTMSQSSFS